MGCSDWRKGHTLNDWKRERALLKLHLNLMQFPYNPDEQAVAPGYSCTYKRLEEDWGLRSRLRHRKPHAACQ